MGKGSRKREAKERSEKKGSKNRGGIKADIHHRRPKSLGGNDLGYNISYVKRREHQYWHILFGNLNSLQIGAEISIRFNCEIEVNFINGDPVEKTGQHCSCRKNFYIIWEKLFPTSSFEEAIKIINSKWLDPSYHLYIKKPAI